MLFIVFFYCWCEYVASSNYYLFYFHLLYLTEEWGWTGILRCKSILACTIWTLWEISFYSVLVMSKHWSLYIKYFSYNYALKSVLLLHANIQRPDITKCNQLLWWPECFYEPISLIHRWYISVRKVSAKQCSVSLRTVAHCWGIKASLKSINDLQART